MTDPAYAYVAGLENSVMAEFRKKSQKKIYQRDPVAWLADTLGKRWWSVQEEIAWSVVENVFTIVKSCNGVGKTQLAGDIVTWWISVFDPMETTALVSAPVRNQIDENMFRYLRDNYNIAKERGRPLIGEITRWPKWVVDTPYHNDLVLPKRPADSNLLSSFQGIHLDNVLVALDEAGGLQEDFFIAANAVTTNEHARVFAIGNPDIPNTAFHERFKSASYADTPLIGRGPTPEELESGMVFQKSDDSWWMYGDKYRDWNRFTIGAKDSPNFTGEEIYPDDPERDKKIKARLVQVSWAQMMRRSASPGVVKAKVDGEFPSETDNTFFIQTVINQGWETFGLMREIGISPHAYKHLGVDVAFAGDDKNVIYLNHGGHITKVDEWGKEEGDEAVEDMAIARRVHAHAKRLGVTELRIDATGASRGVHSVLKTEREFRDGGYILIGVLGASASPNPKIWLNARAWHYDSFRKQLANGAIGIDPQDQDLRTDLEVQTYKFTVQGKLQIDSKEIIKKELKHSPDHLDAAIYSAIDFSGVVNDPTAGHQPGDIVLEDPWEMSELTEAGLPI